MWPPTPPPPPPPSSSSANKPNYIKLPTDQNQVPAGWFPLGSNTPAGAFSTDAVENLIKSKGFKVKHYRYALNPKRSSMEGGVDIKSDTSSKVFTYYDPRELFIDVQQLSWSDQYMQQGIYGNFQVTTLNHCAKYENNIDGSGGRVFLRANDILVAQNDLTVLTEQLIEYNGRQSLQLMFPVFEVDYLADSNNVRYYQNTDFAVCNGCIEWLSSGAKPTFNNGRGSVLSVVYWTKPYFQVIATPRAFRAVYANQFGDPNQPQELTYFPGSAVVKMLWSSRVDFDLPDWEGSRPPQQGENIK